MLFIMNKQMKLLSTKAKDRKGRCFIGLDNVVMGNSEGDWLVFRQPSYICNDRSSAFNRLQKSETGAEGF